MIPSSINVFCILRYCTYSQPDLKPIAVSMQPRDRVQRVNLNQLKSTQMQPNEVTFQRNLLKSWQLYTCRSFQSHAEKIHLSVQWFCSTGNSLALIVQRPREDSSILDQALGWHRSPSKYRSSGNTQPRERFGRDMWPVASSTHRHCRLIVVSEVHQ